MAYAASVTYTDAVIGGRRSVLVTVTETECGTNDEYSLALGTYLPQGIWRIARVTMTITAGSAATVAPLWGRATNPTSGTAAFIGTLGAAASQDSINTGGRGWVANGLVMYARSKPNAGADNSITTQYFLIDGWQL